MSYSVDLEIIREELEAAVLAERERCAKIAEDQSVSRPLDDDDALARELALIIAAKIRSGEKA